MSERVTQTDVLTVQDALRTGRHGGIQLLGQLDRNQGRPTFTGRMTLEQFAEITVVHNRRWADEAGETIDIVTQREIIDNHANGLAVFMLQGLVDATLRRVSESGSGLPDWVRSRLGEIQDHIGRSGHYGIPQVTLVIRETPNVRHVQDGEEVVASWLILPGGTLLIVADGQHRREAARRVKEFLIEVTANRRFPSRSKLFPEDGTPINSEELDAWLAVQETFRTDTRISYEAHIGLTTSEARQMFTNYNCHVKPVKAEINLDFDESNPINQFAKGWLREQLGQDGALDLRQMAQVNGFLFLGKSSIRSAPYNVEVLLEPAREFWRTVIENPDWLTPGTLLREVAVLKGLAKSWFYVFLARRNRRPDACERIRRYVRTTRFNREWVASVPDLEQYTIPGPDGRTRFQPSHNDIVAIITQHALGTAPAA